MSAIAAAPPLYGTWMPVVFVRCQNSSADRWSDDPVPDDTKVSLPGFFCTSPIRSLTLPAATFWLTINTFGLRTATVSRS